MSLLCILLQVSFIVEFPHFRKLFLSVNNKNLLAV